jgi:hypothetical protein
MDIIDAICTLLHYLKDSEKKMLLSFTAEIFGNFCTLFPRNLFISVYSRELGNSKYQVPAEALLCSQSLLSRDSVYLQFFPLQLSIPG